MVQLPEPDERCAWLRSSSLSSALWQQDLPGHRICHDNEKLSWIYHMFKNQAKNGVIIEHPPFDCQETDAPLTDEFPLTFSGTHKTFECFFRLSKECRKVLRLYCTHAFSESFIARIGFTINLLSNRALIYFSKVQKSHIMITVLKRLT